MTAVQIVQPELIVAEVSIRRVEDILTRSRAFRLPGKKRLQAADHEIEFIVVDVAETPVERPNKRARLHAAV